MSGPRFTVRRVRKARASTCCGLCGAPITIGTQECLIEPPDGRGPCYWCHAGCVITTRKTSAGSPSAAPPPAAGGNEE